MNDVTTRRLGALLAGSAAVVAFGIAGSAHASDGTKTSDNGANVSGSYDSSGQYQGPSRNGNGKGKALGRPDAGSVGKADDKNPPGQYPNGFEDTNSGYECDDNSGVGRSNPAHSGCALPDDGGPVS